MVELYPYQKDVSERVIQEWKSGKKRVIGVLCTGAGKGRIQAHHCHLGYKHNWPTLFVADRRKLIRQMAGNLEDINCPYGVIMSGETRKINSTVIVSSRDTLTGWIDNPDLALPQFKQIIIDECHLTLTQQYHQIINRFPNALLFGSTATPIRSDGKSLFPFYDSLVQGIQPSELIKMGRLIKPDVFYPEELVRAKERGEKVSKLAGCPVYNWRLRADGMPTIAFCSSVTESLELMEIFNNAGIPAEHIDADCEDKERERKYDRLKNGTTKVLCSVKLLITGVDIPDVSCGIIWSKMGSLIEWLQAGGRLMRTAPGKTRAVIIDHSGASKLHNVIPGDDIEWSCDPDLDANYKFKEKVKGEKIDKMITCPKCCLTFRARKLCPGCGYKINAKVYKRAAAKSEAYEATDEILVPLDKEQEMAFERDRMQRIWFQSIGIASARGVTAGAAVAIFKSKSRGKFPWDYGLKPSLPAGSPLWKEAASVVFPMNRGGKNAH